MGTPRFGILTYPYPYRYGESPYQYGDCSFLFFFSHAQDRPFLTKQTTTQQTLLQRSPFLKRGMRRGAPPSSRRALTPRQVGAHPARVSARLCLDAPRRGRNGGGVGSDAVAGGAGGGRLGDLPAPAGARRRCRRRRLSQRCHVDGGVIDACVGGCVFVPGGELNEIKKSKKNVFALYGCLPVIQTHQPTKNTRTRHRR